ILPRQRTTFAAAPSRRLLPTLCLRCFTWWSSLFSQSWWANWKGGCVEVITVEKLEKHFGKLQVLRGVNQHIKQGEKVVIIGPSGSVKTTFLRCLNLLEHPTSGRILFEGVDITDPKCDINKIRRKMGMVFQQFNLFPHLNILKN